MSARWEEALDAQLDLVVGLRERWQRGHAEGFGEKVLREEYPGSLGVAFADRLAAMIYNADPVYVDRDMMTVWEGSVDGFVSEPLLAEDLVVPAGFLLLPRPYFLTDVHDRSMSIRAIAWHPQEILIESGTPIERGPEGPTAVVGQEHASQGLQRIPVRQIDGHRLATQGLLLALLHDTRDRDDYSDRDDLALGGVPGWTPGLLVAHVMPWSYGTIWDSAVEDPRSIVRPIQALWRLMNQRIALRTSERATAPFRRRIERAGWPERRVVVVRLRRPAGEEHEPEHRSIEWSRRWVVRAHWRWQPYQAVGGTCSHCGEADVVHRQILIHAFVKGPADKPLVVAKTHVFELVR